MNMSVADRMQHRAKTLKHWLKRSIELKMEEKEVHGALHPDVARVLQGKKILLWEEMLSAINYEDMGVVEEFKAGTMLTGGCPGYRLVAQEVHPSYSNRGRCQSNGQGAASNAQLQERRLL